MATETTRIQALIRHGAQTAMSEKAFLEREILRWKASDERKAMLLGDRYYRGRHDILDRKRQVIGDGGQLQVVENLPNNHIIDNQYAKLVDQKANYLLGKPLTIDTKDKAYEAALHKVFDKRFHRTLKNLGIDALDGGIAWLYPYYDEEGVFRFRRFEPYEVLPFWRDAEHTILDMAVRIYEVTVYEGDREKTVELVEVYKPERMERYVLDAGVLTPDTEAPVAPYVITEGGKGKAVTYNWGQVPVIPFKYNAMEIPLISKVKSLQDGINTMLSDFMNNMQEDARSTILILKNYDGTDLGEFRRNLAQYGVVKVRSSNGVDGGVETLQVEVNSEHYKGILELMRKALIENGMGYDAKDDRMSGQPNQMNIQSMYSDIDLDANGMETEFQASLEMLLRFVNAHLANTGIGDFTSSEAGLIFNRDMMMNETDIINNARTSMGILSQETVVGQHPWVSDVQAELDRLAKEKEAAMDSYGGAFGTPEGTQGSNGDAFGGGQA